MAHGIFPGTGEIQYKVWVHFPRLPDVFTNYGQILKLFSSLDRARGGTIRIQVHFKFCFFWPKNVLARMCRVDSDSHLQSLNTRYELVMIIDPVTQTTSILKVFN